jgi:hypothetical protein
MLKQTVKVFCMLSVLGCGASVTATNLGAGLARGVATDASGVYRIPLLPPGVYEMKIEIKGFSAQILIRGQI